MRAPPRHVFAGGQTGADIGALCGARDAGVATGGWAPRGWSTEKGPQEAVLRSLGLQECQEGRSHGERYACRTLANVKDSDAVLIIGRPSPGSTLTAKLAKRTGKPYLWLLWEDGSFWDEFGKPQSPEAAAQRVREWLEGLDEAPKVLVVAGNRESRNPGIAAAVRHLVRDVLSQMWADTDAAFERDERAAMHEYHGGMSREDAERAAREAATVAGREGLEK